MEPTLGETQNTQLTLARIMEKIQNHIMQDADQDETNVDETLAISEPLPPPARTSREVLLTSFGASPGISEAIPITAIPRRGIVIFSEPSGRTFQEDLEEQL